LLNYRMLHNRVTRLHDMSLPIGSSVPVDSDSNDVSPASLIRDVCTSLNSQSKSVYKLYTRSAVRLCFFLFCFSLKREFKRMEE